MKTKHAIILGAFVLLLTVAIALWLQKEPPSESPQLGIAASQTATVAAEPVQASPVERTPKPVAPSNFSGSPQKKFDDMDVLGRIAIKDEIAKQDLPAIFKAMLDADRVEHDDLKQMHLQTTFSNALSMKKPTPEFLEELYGFITNGANSEFERQLLIGALEGSGTKEAVDLLIRVASTATDKKIKTSAAALAGVGAGGRGGPELSPMLERTWRETSNPTLIRSTASAMAEIGTPSGIDLLLSAALGTDERDKERQIAAQAALLKVYQRDAVPPLAARLANQPPTSEVVKLVAPILARTNGPAGQEALVSWLQSRSENAAPLVHDLIRQQIRTDPLESAWAKALDPAVSFSNEENRKAIREALDAYRAGRTSR